MKAKPLKDKGNIASIVYHDMFDYPLHQKELKKWTYSGPLKKQLKKNLSIKTKNGYYYLKGRHSIIKKRLHNKNSSIDKFRLATNTAKVISRIPTIKMIAVTGSLAMENASEKSDIDLLIITSKNCVWITRFITYILLRISNIKTRKPKQSFEKNLLCLNIWLDEDSLEWKYSNKSPFIAHEICQLRPVYEKDDAYSKFISNNMWVFDYWPQSLHLDKNKLKDLKKQKYLQINDMSFNNHIINLFEKMFYKIQYLKMRKNITNEQVSKKYALFHPVKLNKIVMKNFEKNIFS